eukprot:gene51850-46364_t
METKMILALLPTSPLPSTFKSIDNELRQHCGRDFPGCRDGRRGMRSFAGLN